MAPAIAEQIANQFGGLPPETQLSLLERLIHRMSENINSEEKAFAPEMEAMAADPDIQREIGNANKEFRRTEGDELDKL